MRGTLFCIKNFNFTLFSILFGYLDLFQALYLCFYIDINQTIFNYVLTIVYIACLALCGFLVIYGALQNNRWCLIMWIVFSTPVFMLNIYYLIYARDVIKENVVEVSFFIINYGWFQVHIEKHVLFM